MKNKIPKRIVEKLFKEQEKEIRREKEERKESKIVTRDMDSKYGGRIFSFMMGGSFLFIFLGIFLTQNNYNIYLSILSLIIAGLFLLGTIPYYNNKARKEILKKYGVIKK